MAATIFNLFVVCVIGGTILFISKLFKSPDKGKKDDVVLSTDLEMRIAELEIRPKLNKNIKQVAQYLENILMPNETILAIECGGNTFATVYAIVTDYRVIFENKKNGVEIITPIEKVQSVMQNGTVVNVNGNWINLESMEKASRITNLINREISSKKTVEQVIKIENKVVTEESITSQLKKLSDLHDSKVLTDYEYSVKKQELLNKMK